MFFEWMSFRQDARHKFIFQFVCATSEEFFSTKHKKHWHRMVIRSLPVTSDSCFDVMHLIVPHLKTYYKKSQYDLCNDLRILTSLLSLFSRRFSTSKMPSVTNPLPTSKLVVGSVSVAYGKPLTLKFKDKWWLITFRDCLFVVLRSMQLL